MLRTITLTLLIVLLISIAQPALVRDDDNVALAAGLPYSGDLAFAPDDDTISESIRAALGLSQANSIGLERPQVPGSQLGGLRPNPFQPLSSASQAANPSPSSNLENILDLSLERHNLESRYPRRAEPVPEERFILAVASVAERTTEALASTFHSIISFSFWHSQASPQTMPSEPATNDAERTRDHRGYH
jgi:hypothetical protein